MERRINLPTWRSKRAGHTQLARSDSGASCDTSGGRMLYVGLNSWIRGEPRVAPCPDGGAVNAR
jgi:hypothetical protein